jgi:hypothetical protein
MLLDEGVNFDGSDLELLFNVHCSSAPKRQAREILFGIFRHVGMSTCQLFLTLKKEGKSTKIASHKTSLNSMSR